jgi:hypothetical protein
MRLNGMGEFVDDGEPRTVRVRTDEEKRAWAIRRLEAMGVRVCDICGKPFRPVQSRQKRCSFACKMEANRRRARERCRRGCR